MYWHIVAPSYWHNIELLAQNMMNEQTLPMFQVRELWFREVDNLSRVTQLITETAGLQTQGCLIPKLTFIAFLLLPSLHM